MDLTQSDSLQVHVENEVAVVTIDCADQKLNTLSKKFMTDFEALWAALDGAAGIKAVVLISGKPDNFVAGADIHEIEQLNDVEEAADASRFGQRVLQSIESLSKPVVAAIHGGCLGGGCELVLACHHRIMTDAKSSRIGLPEVRLGIIPGFGGTQRLPRVVGLQASLDLILTGKFLDAKRALRLGLVDEVTSQVLLRLKAMQAAEKLVQHGKFSFARPVKKSLLSGPGFLDRTKLGQLVVLNTATKRVKKQTHGHYPAPLAAIESVRQGLRSNGRAYSKEALLLGQMAVTEVCKNLVRVYRLTEGNKKVGADLGEPIHVERIGVLGAGVMGGGIAHLAAGRDIMVRLKDINSEALLTAFRTARGLFMKQVRRRRMDPITFDSKMAKISGTLDYSGFALTQVVIEAVVEDMKIKKNVLSELEANVGENTVLATNTSSLSVGEMTSALKDPSRLVGMHFFNPVHRMPLVEVITTEKSHPRAVASIITLARRLGKTPVVVKDAPGFLVNRILAPYMNEASRLFEEGQDLKRIDRAAKDFGMPMGPFELMDEVGNDVAAKVGVILHKGLGERMAPSNLLEKLIVDKRLGRKSGQGFYVYQANTRSAKPDPKYWATLRDARAKQMAAEEIIERILALMINEATSCLADGIVSSAEELDLAMIFGTGFPPFRGGLLRYADSRGVDHWVQTLERLQAVHGDRFAPCALLQSLSKEHRDLYGTVLEPA